jgi:hypothetical protein
MCIEDRIARALADANDPNLADFMANDGYPGDTPPYQGKHRAADVPGEAPESYDWLNTQAPDGSWYHRFPTEPVPASVSIFDAPDAATTHAKQTAQALIHEYQTFASQPGHWTDANAASWIGQACAVLTELAK